MAPAFENDRPATAGEVVRSLVFYIVFYVGTLGLVLATIVSLAFSPAISRKVARAWSLYHRLCCRVLLGIRVVREGPMPGGAVLYALRHESFFEAIDLPGEQGPPVVFAKQELLRIPLWGIAGRRYGLIGVDRSAGARALRNMVTTARERVSEGRPLAIFPEGTRVPHGKSPPLQSGFAGIYKLLKMPVVPVAVDSGRLYHRRWKRSGVIRYRYGALIPPGLERTDIEARVHAAINALNHD